MGSRKLYMLDGIFLAEKPRFKIRVAIRHHPKNNPGHFQSRVAQANCGRSRQRQLIYDKRPPAIRGRRTVWNLFHSSGSRHGYGHN